MCVSPVSISDASSCAVRSTEYNEEDLNKTFYEIASTEISDKVASPGFKFWKTHNFDDIYQRYLGPLRSSSFKLLEIGLGCSMPAGPGRSIPIWRRFLPCAQVSILEYDESCAKSFRHKLENLFIGDQSSREVLDSALAGGPYLVAVDDGSHKSTHQIASFTRLFPYLMSGGVYFIEDLHCAMDTNALPTDKPGQLFIAALSLAVSMRDITGAESLQGEVQHLFDWAADVRKLAPYVLHIDCGPAICAIIRNGKMAKNFP